MGENKLLLQLDGESLVRRAARRALGAALHPVVVVLGHESDRVRPEIADLPVAIVVNVAHRVPASSSLHRGLEALGSEVPAAAVILADMVFVTEAMLAAVVDAAAATQAPLVISRYGDVTAPPLLFRRSLFPELLACTGEGCGKAVASGHFHEAVILDWPASALNDVDTPEDFRRVIQGP